MKIEFKENQKCHSCHKDSAKAFELLRHVFCRDCLLKLGNLIGITVMNFDRENPQSVFGAELLERVLEKARNMSDDEYMELHKKAQEMSKNFEENLIPDDIIE
jgi:hypothetical protein